MLSGVVLGLVHTNVPLTSVSPSFIAPERVMVLSCSPQASVVLLNVGAPVGTVLLVASTLMVRGKSAILPEVTCTVTVPMLPVVSAATA